MLCKVKIDKVKMKMGNNIEKVNQVLHFSWKGIDRYCFNFDKSRNKGVRLEF